MAKKEARMIITLACQTCKNRNYSTNKNRHKNPDRIEFKKYCPTCKKHTIHKEVR
ncbi:MAG: 50S ribosomal protein L33 [Chloroflexi bacterium]|nr:50S ribosomal protein L33 [Chloroflexota bacterium]